MIETIKNHKLGQVLDSWGFRSFFTAFLRKKVARVGMRCITCFVKHNSNGVLTTFELQMAQQKLDESTYSRYEKWSTWDAPQPNWTFTNGVWLIFPQATKIMRSLADYKSVGKLRGFLRSQLLDVNSQQVFQGAQLLKLWGFCKICLKTHVPG